MITLDTDSHFIHVKFENPENLCLPRCTVAEVFGMARQLSVVEKSRVASDKKHEVKTCKGTERLDDLLFDAVDETLTCVFKEAGVEVIYDFLENNSHLKRVEIAEKPEVFSAGLERLLGSAAPVIEKMILKNVYRKLGLRFREKKGYVFSDYVKELRKRSEG